MLVSIVASHAAFLVHGREKAGLMTCQYTSFSLVWSEPKNVLVLPDPWCTSGGSRAAAAPHAQSPPDQ